MKKLFIISLLAICGVVYGQTNETQKLSVNQYLKLSKTINNCDTAYIIYIETDSGRDEKQSMLLGDGIKLSVAELVSMYNVMDSRKEFVYIGESGRILYFTPSNTPTGDYNIGWKNQVGACTFDEQDVVRMLRWIEKQ